MLKLTRGAEVEMLSKKEADVFGAWVCAEVITSTAYTCTVKFVGGSGDGIVEEIVPREAVRPLPPPLEGVANFTPGDLVECCHSFSWKTAKILKAVTDNIFLVRLLGVSDVGFIVHKSFLRVRQLWTGAEWYVLGKNSTTSMCACAKENDEDSESVASTSTTYGSCNSSTEEEEEEGNESEEYSPSTFGALLPTYPWEFTVIFFFSIFFPLLALFLSKN